MAPLIRYSALFALRDCPPRPSRPPPCRPSPWPPPPSNPCFEAHGERTLLALCSGAQHGAPSRAIRTREGLRRAGVKVARQSVAVAAAAPSPRTTAWGDGVGRLHAVGAEQWRPSRRALACHQEARGLAKGGREDGKAVRGSGSSVWRGRRGQSQPRRVANQAASPPPTPDVPTTARGSGPCGLRPKILRMCDRDSPCGPMGGARRPLGLIP